jgi:hypothetical protein
MARRVSVYKVTDLINEIDTRLQQFNLNLKSLSLREKVLRLAELHFKARCLGVSVVVEDGLSPTAATDRISIYLKRHVGTVIDGVELDVVSGISEYARRIRELRVERGFRIVTGASPDEDSGVALKPDQYMLISADVDMDAARRWHVAQRIRRQHGGSKAKILAYFKENVGKVVTTEELAYVAKNKSEFGRRTRELRTEDGYAIATKTTGRPDLRVGEYIMLSLQRVSEPHDRYIKPQTQREVYERDHSTCRNPDCGWHMQKWTPEDPRILELHHIQAHAKRGENSAENLIVLCSYCHDEVHAGRLDITLRLGIS